MTNDVWDLLGRGKTNQLVPQPLSSNTWRRCKSFEHLMVFCLLAVRARSARGARYN